MTRAYRLRSARTICALAAAATLTGAGCRSDPPTDRVRVSGSIEATEVRVAPKVGGRILEIPVVEGQRVEPGAVVIRLDAGDAELGLARARADRDQADAQLRLLLAGTRQEDVRQADAQLATAQAEAGAAEADLAGAQTEADRFEALLASGSGTRRQRDEAVARRNIATGRLQAARERVRAAAEGLARLRAGARREEVDLARARVAGADAQIATLQRAIADATVMSPVGGVVVETLANAGEIAQPFAPLLIVADLAHAWANVYIDEPLVPRLRLGQPAVLFTGAGGPGVTGSIGYISSEAEFTPRNVQTAEDRSKLVYRVKIDVDNTDGVLKLGMPVEADIQLAP